MYRFLSIKNLRMELISSTFWKDQGRKLYDIEEKSVRIYFRCVTV